MIIDNNKIKQLQQHMWYKVLTPLLSKTDYSILETDYSILETDYSILENWL